MKTSILAIVISLLAPSTFAYDFKNNVTQDEILNASLSACATTGRWDTHALCLQEAIKFALKGKALKVFLEKTCGKSELDRAAGFSTHSAIRTCFSKSIAILGGPISQQIKAVCETTGKTKEIAQCYLGVLKAK